METAYSYISRHPKPVAYSYISRKSKSWYILILPDIPNHGIFLYFQKVLTMTYSHISKHSTMWHILLFPDILNRITRCFKPWHILRFPVLLQLDIFISRHSKQFHTLIFRGTLIRCIFLYFQTFWTVAYSYISRQSKQGIFLYLHSKQ